MVTNNSNKVLTVSYGTFSCTLEGFDDSFGMMKEVAEYFRDLAEQDRFFGAEPPKLDAEMLTILAKRSNQKGIAARTEGTNVVLSPARTIPVASDAQPIAPPTRPAPPLQDTNEAAQTLTLEERLQKIRSVVNANTTASAALKNAISDIAEDEPMDQEVLDRVASPESAAENHGDAVQHDETENDIEGTEVTMADDTPEAPEVIEDHAPLETDPLDLGVDTFVLRPSDDQRPEQSDSLEQADEVSSDHGTTDFTAQEDVLSDTNAADEISDDVMGQDADADAELEAILNAAPDTYSALEIDAESAPEPRDHDADAAVGDESVHAPAKREGRVHVIDLRDTAATDDTADTSFEDELSKALDLDVDLEPEAEIDIAFDDDDEQPDAAVAKPDDADAQEHNETAEQDRIVPQRPTVKKVSSDRRGAGMDAQQNTITRLMDQTDQKMAQPDNSRRRNALAHLRAAVAATMADKSLVKSKKSDAADAYRNDLAQAVRPTRPTRTGQDAPAPLRLVAEQRIDVASTQEQTLHQPPAAKQASPEFESFDEYVAFVGAHTLPAKLEAAATYLAEIKGIEHFSRPQIMRTIMAAEGEAFQREESLKNFARMINDGKIVRNPDGLFGITSDIGYRLDDRKTG